MGATLLSTQVSLPPLHHLQNQSSSSSSSPSSSSLIYRLPLYARSSSKSAPISSSTSFKLHASSTTTTTTTTEANKVPISEEEEKVQKFNWYEEWYAVAPLCDLDKRVPHAKRILGIDLVVWWDRNANKQGEEGEWKVFEDKCPHRLAPLSEGRIDGQGRLQCVYHGWCFNGSGNCQLIPQAPLDGPPVHSSKKACVASYPCTVQNDLLWFWPNSDPLYHDILTKKQPPYIAELDNPSFAKSMGTRDINYGYDILIENLMDPAHVPYAHYGIMRVPSDKNRPKADREGGRPLDIAVQQLDHSGFFAKQQIGFSKFIPPCLFYVFPSSVSSQPQDALPSQSVKDSEGQQRKFLLIFLCIPVSPGESRLIWSFPRNFGVWIDQIVPRWIFHIGQNLILDSDLYLLHMEEHKIMEAGPANWQKACFVPTKSDALVVGFRKWLNKYAGGGVDWRLKFDGSLPPTPPREQLMDRYWTHVVNCTSCSAAYKWLNITETVLQIISIGLIGVAAIARQGTFTTLQRSALFSAALLCFAASKWLSRFIYKNFHFHDYNHAFV